MNHGKFQKYLGMILYYTTVGQVKITMFDYIDEILDIFDKSDPTGGGTKSSAAPAILFKFDKYRKKINAKKTVEFHHLVSKILFAIKRTRPDTWNAILFLTTIGIERDNENWAKLVHIVK